MAEEGPPGLVDVVEADRVEHARLQRLQRSVDNSAHTVWHLEDTQVSDHDLVTSLRWGTWSLDPPASTASYVSPEVARLGLQNSAYARTQGFATRVCRCIVTGPSTPRQAMWAAMSIDLAGQGVHAGKRVNVLSLVNPANGLFALDAVDLRPDDRRLQGEPDQR